MHDFNLNSFDGIRQPGAADAYDAQLTAGRSVYDPAAGCTIELLSVSAREARIRVTVDEGAAMATLGEPAAIGVVTPRIGWTASGVQRYEFTAHDPDVGTNNGDGITKVTLLFVPPPNGSSSGHGGGEGGTIERAEFTKPPYVLNVDTREHPDGMAWLRIQVEAEDGGDNSSGLHHLVDNTGPSF